jgi:nucleotide-binding universal stress UspA family protein
MKAIIGVDAKKQYRSALKLFGALQFPSAEVMLMHASSPVLALAPVSLIAGVEAETRYAEATEKRGLQLLEEAKALACDLEIRAQTTLKHGSPADVLTKAVADEGADLVAVCETKPGAWTTTFFGGVSRSLAIDCQASLLVAKGRMRRTHGLTAVLATDHSAYAEKCLRTFLRMAPKGIQRIIVLSAIELSGDEAAILSTLLPPSERNVEDWIAEDIEHKNAEVAEKLRSAGYVAETSVMHGSANECIASLMRKEEADLLIMGAQGRGFLDRLFIGSVSLHQVVAEPYPVLLLRA